MTKPSYMQHILVTCAAVIIILAGIKQASQIVVPFLLALFIAITCSPLITALTKRRVPLGLAIGMLFFLIAIMLFFFFGLINNTIQEFSASIPQYRLLLSERLTEVLDLAARWNIELPISKENILEQFDPSTVMNFVSRLLLSFSGVVTNVFVLLLVVVFMLLEAPTAKHKIALALSRDNDVESVLREERHINQITQSVIGYLGVKTLTSLITGLIIWGVLDVFDVQYAILWATLSFLLNYIPNIGAIIATVPIILQAFLLNGVMLGFAVSVVVILVNMLIGSLVEPKMMGKTLGLSTLVVFLSLLFWGWLLGTVGMLLSVPLTMALKISLESSDKTKKYAALLGNVKSI